MNRENKKMLIALDFEQSKLKHPTLPDHCRAKYSKNDKTTNGLTTCVIDFLNMSGHQAERISSSGRWVSNGGRKQIDYYTGKESATGKWIKGSGTKGTADISSTINGRSVKIEVKFGKDKMSDYQHKYKEQIEKAGGVYMIARDFDSWYEEFKTIF